MNLYCEESGEGRMFTAGRVYAARPGSGITHDITDDLGRARTLTVTDGRARFIARQIPDPRSPYYPSTPVYARFRADP